MNGQSEEQVEEEGSGVDNLTDEQVRELLPEWAQVDWGASGEW